MLHLQAFKNSLEEEYGTSSSRNSKMMQSELSCTPARILEDQTAEIVDRGGSAGEKSEDNRTQFRIALQSIFCYV